MDAGREPMEWLLALSQQELWAVLISVYIVGFVVTSYIVGRFKLVDPDSPFRDPDSPFPPGFGYAFWWPVMLTAVVTVGPIWLLSEAAISMFRQMAKMGTGSPIERRED